MGLSGFFPFLVLFSSPFTFEILQTTKFCVLMRKKGRKENPLLFIQPSNTRKVKDLRRVLKKLGPFEIIWSLCRSGPAMFCLSHYILVRERNIIGPLEAKHCKAIVQHKDQNISNDLFFSNFVFARCRILTISSC